jgi:hypothetical protein
MFLIALWLIHAPAAHAQAGPSITFFTSDRATITPDEAESGTAYVNLAWQIGGMRPGETAHLQVYVLRAWHAALPDALPASGTLRWAAPHSLDFSPPSFRLAVRDAAGQTVASADLVIPYPAAPDPANPPQIVSFTSPLARISEVALRERNGLIPVTWKVKNRPARANLVFEQVLDSGRIVSVELPRSRPWIRSAGEGMLQPQPGRDSLLLRAGLVDIDTGQVYAEQTLSIQVVRAGISPTPTATPAPGVPTTSGEPEVTSFTATKYVLKRGETIRLAWQARNAVSMTIETYEIDYFPHYVARPPDNKFENLPLNGTLDVTVPASYRGGGWQIHLIAQSSGPPRYTKRLDVIFSDVEQPIILNARTFRVSTENVRRGDTLTVTWDMYTTMRTSINGVVNYQQPISGFEGKLWLDVRGVVVMGIAPDTPLNRRFTGLKLKGSLQITVPNFDAIYDGVWLELGMDVNGQPIAYQVQFVALSQ